MTKLPFALLDFSDFRFCVINHVSAPKLLSLISVTCPKHTRKAYTVPYNELCHHLLDSLAPSVYTLLYNPVGPRQFCALPNECLALWQSQQLDVSVCHASAVDMLGAHVTTCQHLSCYCWKPCTIPMPVFMVLHILHTPAPTGATHITHKNQNTLHSSSLPWFRKTIRLQSDILMLSTHSCTMTQSTCAKNYMLKSAVLWYYFMLDMLLPYFFKLPCVPVRGRKHKIWYKEHTHNREYKWDE